MMITHTTSSAQETQKIGSGFAKEILQQGPRKQATVIALEGDLGAGKTTFAQGFAQGLGVEEKVLSPTFVVLKRFALPTDLFKNFFHIDCYRMDSSADMRELGLQEIFSNPENIVLVEWPERLGDVLPSSTLEIHLSHGKGDERILEIKA